MNRCGRGALGIVRCSVWSQAICGFFVYARDVNGQVQSRCDVYITAAK